MIGRRLKALLGAAALLALPAAGCGGDDGGGGPLDDALGFMPKEAPLVVSIDTDVNGPQARAAERILARFPFSNRLLEGLQRSILGDVEFQRDVRPLLGNEFVVGAVDAESLASDEADTDFVGAIRASDQGKLREAIKRGGAEQRGEKSGAKLYEDSDGDVFAVRDDVLVVASERGLLEDAVARRDAGDGLDEDAFDQATKGLDGDALARAYADIQALLAADSGTAGARRIKWVNALRRLGLSASASRERIDVRFRMATEPDGLSEEDLPIAPGDAGPSVITGAGEVDGGIRDPAHIVAFAEGAARAVDPEGFRRYALGKRTIERSLGVDLEDDLLGQLEEDLTVGIDLDGAFGARATVKDPAAFGRTLERLSRAVPSIAERIADQPVEFARPSADRPLYVLSAEGGEEILAYGLVDGAFVVATDAGRAARLARQRPVPLGGARGAVAARADAARLVRMLIGTLDLGGAGEVEGRALSAPLDEARMSVSAGEDALEGTLSLTLEPR